MYEEEDGYFALRSELNATDLFSSLVRIIVGNKAKGQISKRVFQENKAHQIFRKTNISHPLIRT